LGRRGGAGFGGVSSEQTLSRTATAIIGTSRHVAVADAAVSSLGSQKRADLFPGPELLFGLGDVYLGQGLATEAATGVLRYAFEGLGCAVVGAATDAANSRSSRVLGRLGMRLLRRADHQGLDTLFYGMSRSEWNRGDFMPGE